MVRKRAVERGGIPAISENLPLLYRSLTPLVPGHHDTLYLSETRDYQFAAETNVIPLTCDEFPRALHDYPIVIAPGERPVPVALVGFAQGRNDHVEADGAWRAGCYVPAYVRRFPFVFVRESAKAERNILCADLSSTLFSPRAQDGAALFENGAPAPALDSALDFCKRYETARERTRLVLDEARELDLVQPATVSVTREGRTIRIEGFSVFAEEKIRALDDTRLADLARRGVLTLFAAHHLSLSRFADFEIAA